MKQNWDGSQSYPNGEQVVMIDSNRAGNSSSQTHRSSHRRLNPGAKRIAGAEEMDRDGYSSLFTLALVLGILGMIGFILVLIVVMVS